MGHHKDERPVTHELGGGELQGAKEHFYTLPVKRIPNCPPRQLDSYHRAHAAHSIMIGLSRRPVKYRTDAAALGSREFIDTWDKMEAAEDEAVRYAFFILALRKLINLQAHHRADIRHGRGRLL
jgi:hypothetical protein